MPTLGGLRSAAKAMGIPANVIRGATSVAELQAIIMDEMNHADAPKPKPAVRKKPKTGTVSKSASSKSKPAAKSTVGKAKRTTAASDDDAGRHLLGKLDYTITKGWNPRIDSAPYLILKSLRKYRGNRDRVFNDLVGNLWDFVGKKKLDGTRRTQDDAENMLRYRIARTDWDYAMKTEQHAKSENRKEYERSNGASKPAAAPKPARTAPKRGKAASAGVRTKPKAQTATQPKRRGRPPGSKNTPKPVVRKKAANGRRTRSK